MSRSHLFAVFQDSARPPSGLETTPRRQKAKFEDVLQEQQELKRRCSATLQRTSSHHDRSDTVELDRGTGFCFCSNPYCHYTSRDGVHGLFAGEVSEWPGIDRVAQTHSAFVRGESPSPEANDATFLLDFYDTFNQFIAEDVVEAALTSLAKVKGQFAFVVYDTVQRRVLAARDAAGTQPLYWGSTPDGRFMFGSDVADLDACEPTATAFPSGSLFASEDNLRATSPGDQGWVLPGEQWPGRVYSFVQALSPKQKWRDVRAIPRINSRGAVCGAVYRIASERNLANNEGGNTVKDVIRVPISVPIVVPAGPPVPVRPAEAPQPVPPAQPPVPVPPPEDPVPVAPPAGARVPAAA